MELVLYFVQMYSLKVLSFMWDTKVYYISKKHWCRVIYNFHSTKFNYRWRQWAHSLTLQLQTMVLFKCVINVNDSLATGHKFCTGWRWAWRIETSELSFSKIFVIAPPARLNNETYIKHTTIGRGKHKHLFILICHSRNCESLISSHHPK